MKISGSAALHAPVERVYAALNDPAILVRTIPGCQKLEAAGQDSYRMTVAAGVASIKGVYEGEVTLSDQQPPSSFRLKASGGGAPGTVDADVLVRLTEAGDGTTRLEYDADAVVGGMIGGVGQRLLAGVANKTAGEFFKAVDEVLNGAEPAPSAAPSTAPSAEERNEVAAPAAAGQAREVFTAPATAAQPAPVGVFIKGAVLGAGFVLAGVITGFLMARGG
ncbi:MAG: carbon monoxide dehydrogenase subunit G [Actinomadura sp.]